MEGEISSSRSLSISYTSTFLGKGGSTCWIGLTYRIGCSTFWNIYGGGLGIVSCTCTCGMVSWTFFFFVSRSIIASYASTSKMSFCKLFLISVDLCKAWSVYEGWYLVWYSTIDLPLSFDFSIGVEEELDSDYFTSFYVIFFWTFSSTINLSFL